MQRPSLLEGKPANTEDLCKTFSENLKISRKGKPSTPLCSHCGKPPPDNERFSKCARCKAMVYCSRQCQKKDWPDHKPSCIDGEKQRDFVIKCMIRLTDDKAFKVSLGLALAEQFYESLITDRNPQKMRIAAAHLILLPRDDKDFDALESPDIPIDSLVDTPMYGRLMISKIEDGSDQEDFPIDERAHAIWRHARDAMDRAGRIESHMMLVIFLYNGNIFYVLSKAVHPQELRDVGISRVWGDVGDWREKRMQNPGLEQINDAIALEDAVSKKFRCLMNDEDKRFIRVWSTTSAVLDKEMIQNANSNV